jgi:hypothetical protein
MRTPHTNPECPGCGAETEIADMDPRPNGWVRCTCGTVTRGGVVIGHRTT